MLRYISILLLPVFAFAQESSLPEKAQKLKAAYEGAVAKATTPLTKTYLAELEKLKVGYTKSADLQSALAVEAEIKRLTPAPGPKAVADAAQNDTVLLDGTIWIADDGVHRVVFLPQSQARINWASDPDHPKDYPYTLKKEKSEFVISVPMSKGFFTYRLDRRMKELRGPDGTVFKPQKP